MARDGRVELVVGYGSRRWYGRLVRVLVFIEEKLGFLRTMNMSVSYRHTGHDTGHRSRNWNGNYMGVSMSSGSDPRTRRIMCVELGL